jgi:ArsR family transcriptional regulator, virulence genes transcriptional regulator
MTRHAARVAPAAPARRRGNTTRRKLAAPGPSAASAADIALLQAKASEAAGMLRLLANDRRLLLLCHLIAEGEVTVTRLTVLLDLAQSAVSQHLARLREDGLVATRRHGTTIYYRVADPRVGAILQTLRDVFCPPES